MKSRRNLNEDIKLLIEDTILCQCKGRRWRGHTNDNDAITAIVICWNNNWIGKTIKTLDGEYTITNQIKAIYEPCFGSYKAYGIEYVE